MLELLRAAHDDVDRKKQVAKEPVQFTCLVVADHALGQVHDEQVDVAPRACFAAHGRAEEEDRLRIAGLHDAIPHLSNRLVVYAAKGFIKHLLASSRNLHVGRGSPYAAFLGGEYRQQSHHACDDGRCALFSGTNLEL